MFNFAPKYQRMLTLFLMLLGLALAVYFILLGFRENIVYFQKPYEVKINHSLDKSYRIGAIVKEGSLSVDPKTLLANFIVTDRIASIAVSFQGALPDLFREGQVIIIEGSFKADGSFSASQVLAKHDENYKPPQLEGLETQ